MRVPLIATKNMTYATRQLKAEDSFEASRQDARVLQALGRARPAEDETAKQEAVLTALRAEYTDVVGKRPFHGWDEDQLRERIAASKSED